MASMVVTRDDVKTMKAMSAGSLVGEWIEVDGFGIGKVTDIHRAKVHFVKASRHTIDFTLAGQGAGQKRILLRRNKWSKDNGGKAFKKCTAEVAAKYEDCKLQGFESIKDYERMKKLGFDRKADIDKATQEGFRSWSVDAANGNASEALKEFANNGHTFSDSEQEDDDDDDESDKESGTGNAERSNILDAQVVHKDEGAAKDTVNDAQDTNSSNAGSAEGDTLLVGAKPSLARAPHQIPNADFQGRLGMPKTDAESDAAGQLLALIKADGRLHTSMMQNAAPHENETQLIIRFLRGSKGKVDDAVKLIRDDVAWREEKNILSYRTSPGSVVLGCEQSQIEPFFPHGFLGYDKKKRPVLYKHYGKFILSKLKPFVDYKTLIEYDIWITERMVSLMGPDAVQQVMILDMKGVTLSMLTPSQMKYCKGLAEAASPHYPERMGQVLIINAPKVFLRA